MTMPSKQPLMLDGWFYENGGGTCFMLAWKIDDGDWEIVPDSAFSLSNQTETTTTTTQPATTTTERQQRQHQCLLPIFRKIHLPLFLLSGSCDH
jgi:hypothetical protein